MNRLLKSILLVLGIGLVGYAFYFKEAAVCSPESALENSLLNSARKDPEAFSVQFREFIGRMASGWNPVMVIGLAIILTAAAIKIPAKPGPPTPD